MHLIFLSLCFSSLIVRTTAGDCDPIPVCSDFQISKIEEKKPKIDGFKNESEIGQDGHWEGVVPENYNLELNFVNRTHYNGSVGIRFKLVKPTRRIMVNHHTANPEIDYGTIKITPQCGGDREKRSTEVATRCIERATFLEAEETLILELKGAELTVEKRYVLSFPSFGGRSQDYSGAGAIGLRGEATKEAGGEIPRPNGLGVGKEIVC